MRTVPVGSAHSMVCLVPDPKSKLFQQQLGKIRQSWRCSQVQCIHGVQDQSVHKFRADSFIQQVTSLRVCTAFRQATRLEGDSTCACVEDECTVLALGDGAVVVAFAAVRGSRDVGTAVVVDGGVWRELRSEGVERADVTGARHAVTAQARPQVLPYHADTVHALIALNHTRARRRLCTQCVETEARSYSISNAHVVHLLLPSCHAQLGQTG